MSIDPSVDLSQEPLPFILLDAPLKNPQGAALVKDVSYDHERFAVLC
jgi:hypothetical protein